MSSTLPTSDTLTDQLASLLKSISTLSLATVDRQGQPHAANLYFAPDEELNLYFVSDPASTHSQHVIERPAVAATLYAPVKMWQQIRGVQLHGRCDKVEFKRWDVVWQIYLRKFPHIVDVQELVRSQQFYRISPQWYRLIDNTVKFGYKVETDWPLTNQSLKS